RHATLPSIPRTQKPGAQARPGGCRPNGFVSSARPARRGVGHGKSRIVGSFWVLGPAWFVRGSLEQLEFGEVGIGRFRGGPIRLVPAEKRREEDRVDRE